MIEKAWTVIVKQRRLPGFVSRRIRSFSNRYYRVVHSNRIPIPPPDLLSLVVGKDYVKNFLRGGKRGVDDIRAILEANGLKLEDFRTVFDFGCGCGRIIRNLLDLPAELYGSDYNEELIDWCRENLPFAQFQTNALAPPLDYDDRSFDFVYCFSVFTHLREDLQHAWLKEMHRVVSDDGYLLITVHGERFIKTLGEETLASAEPGSTIVLNPQESGKNGCAAFHPEEYVRNKWSELFTIVDFMPDRATACGMQDAYLLKKKSR